MTGIVAFDLEGLKREQKLLSDASMKYGAERHKLICTWADEVMADCPADGIPAVELRGISIIHLVGGVRKFLDPVERREAVESLVAELTYELEQSWSRQFRGVIPWKLQMNRGSYRSTLSVVIEAVAKDRIL